MRASGLWGCAAAVVALVLSGCESSPGEGGSGSGAEFGSFATLADGVKDKRGQTQSAHLNIVVTTGGASVTAEGDVLFGDKPAMQMNLGLPETADGYMRLVDGVLYVEQSAFRGGKPWARIDLDGVKPGVKTAGGAVAQLKAMGDPAQLLAQFAQSGTITGKTTDTVRGEQTTHHTVTVDLRKAAAGQPDPDLKKAMEAAVAAGVTDFPLEVWLNQDGLPARLVTEIPGNDPRTGQATNTKISADYTEWGKPVTVTAPPASEVG